MADEEITVGTVNEGPNAGDQVRLPVVDLLTGRGFVTGKSGAGKSVLAGTPVYTKNGRKPIEDIEKGEKVLSLNKHSYEQEFREVQATLAHQSEELLKITLEDGTELVGTKDHSFLTIDSLEIVPIAGSDVEEGTWMPLSRRLPSVETRTKIDLAQYVTPANNITVGENEIRSGKKSDSRYLDLHERTGRVIGLYLAEGSLDSHLTVQIAATDENVRQFLGNNGFKPYEKTCNRSFKPFGVFLQTEFKRGAGNKQLPNWVFNTPDSFKAGLLSGYFDGDGSVTESEITVMSKSDTLLDGVQELLRQFGVSSTVREKLVLYNEEELLFKRLTVDACSVDRFHDVVGLHIERKQQRLTALRNRLDDGDSFNLKDLVPNFGQVLNVAARERGWTKRDSRKHSNASSIHNLTRKQKTGRETFNHLCTELDVTGRARQFGESDILWKRVVSVEELDEQRAVYDLDIAHNDNFIANGVFVHNSNSVSVIAEKLLDRGYALLVVDIDGEYYGLKEQYELLHVGADEECDIRVGPEHAEKIATLALENNVPIILDVSSYLDESESAELLKAIARQLFTKEKKLKKPFLLLIEEIHEYIPEGGGLDECGRMLIKIGKRGRKHGLGIIGVSQRPADVKKDFITQCDWRCWHRLTWNNDTQVVRRVLSGTYAEAVESLADGEAFLRADWSSGVRRVQFDRKKTFDAGATPGLEEFERPDLKPVDTDLVSELQEISEEERHREAEIERLESELAEKETRIEALERDLEEARDLRRMADEFASALFDHPGHSRAQIDAVNRFDVDRLRETAAVNPDETIIAPTTEHNGDSVDPSVTRPNVEPTDEPSRDESQESRSESAEDDREAQSASSSRTSSDDITERSSVSNQKSSISGDITRIEDSGQQPEPDGSGDSETDGEDGSCGETDLERLPSVIQHVRREIESLDPTARAMLATYYTDGPLSPVAAHTRAGDDGDRMDAYRHNSSLRRAEFITHVGRGQYEYAVPDRITDTSAERSSDCLASLARVERELLSEADGRQ